MKNLKIALAFFAYVVLCIVSPLSAVETEKWPRSMMDTIKSRAEFDIDRSHTVLNDFIFDSINNNATLSHEFDNGMSVGVSVNRKVLDNEDIANSYTVIDTFSVPIAIPIDLGLSIPLGEGGHAGISMALGAGITVKNVRQVSSNDVSSIALIDSKKAKVESYIGAIGDESDEDCNDDICSAKIVGDESEGSKVFTALASETENPKNKARYQNMLNMLVHPLKLPLTGSAVDRMPVGEISSYQFNGYVELSGNIGWGAYEGLGSVDATVTTYLKGNFGISVLKESEDSARVKLERMHSKGVSASIGTSIDGSKVPVVGYIVTAGKAIGLDTSIVPFKFEADINLSKKFNVYYKYDLKNKNARSAYQKAVFGLFSKSEELAKKKDGVEFIIERKEETVSMSHSYSANLMFFLSKKKSTGFKVSEIDVKLPDEKHKFFVAERDYSKGYDTIVKIGEGVNYKFKAVINEGVYKKTRDEGLALKIEGDIHDSYTSADELEKYILEIEESTGEYGLFPKFPTCGPDADNSISDKVKCKIINYGNTSFFYRIGLTRRQVDLLVTVNEAKMWEILEKAFGEHKVWRSKSDRALYDLKHAPQTLANIPLAFVGEYYKKGGRLYQARKFMRNWKKLQDEYYGPVRHSDKEFIQKVSNLFKTSNFGPELIKVVRGILKGEKIDFYLSGSAPLAFGKIEKAGELWGNTDKKLRASEVAERMRYREVKPSYSYTVDLKVKTLNDDSVELSIDVDEAPKFLFFSVNRTSRWKGFKNVARFGVLNDKGLLKKGSNKIIISKSNKKGYKGLLADAIFNKYSKSYKTLKFAVSKDAKSWSNTVSFRFKVID